MCDVELRSSVEFAAEPVPELISVGNCTPTAGRDNVGSTVFNSHSSSISPVFAILVVNGYGGRGNGPAGNPEGSDP